MASRYAAIIVPDEAGQVSDFIVSGLTSVEHQGLWDMTEFLPYVPAAHLMGRGDGSRGRTRTCDPAVNSRLLYH